jgi:hypothetical protein
MVEAKSNRLTRYFSLLLDALRSTDPAATARPRSK